MQYIKISEAARIVVKVGSQILTTATGDLDRDSIGSIATALVELCKGGRELVVVTSGAVSAGKEAITLNNNLRTVAEKQAAAAVGQVRLMRAYEIAFTSLGRTVAQVLITRDDISNRKRIVNARATIDMLLSLGVIPLVNENSSVTTEELRFEGDNELSVRIADLVEADLLLMLTNIAGQYTHIPN